MKISVNPVACKTWPPPPPTTYDKQYRSPARANRRRGSLGYTLITTLVHSCSAKSGINWRCPSSCSWLRSPSGDVTPIGGEGTRRRHNLPLRLPHPWSFHQNDTNCRSCEACSGSDVQWSCSPSGSLGPPSAYRSGAWNAFERRLPMFVSIYTQ